jgi:excisionase family DNA binding protein
MQTDLTAEDVAARLGVDKETVYRWLRQNQLRGYKLPRKAGWRILPQDLETYIQGHMNGAPPSQGGAPILSTFLSDPDSLRAALDDIKPFLTQTPDTSALALFTALLQAMPPDARTAAIEALQTMAEKR